jgi:hypothetical protein
MAKVGGDTLSKLSGVRVSAFKEQYKPLYGLLLAANQRLEEVGDLAIWFLILLAIGCSVGLHLAWLDEWIGYSLAALRNWYVYILIWLAAFALFGIHISIGQKWVYAQLRSEIAAAMRRNGYSQYTLLAEIEGDLAVKRIAEHLKQDRELDRFQVK